MMTLYDEVGLSRQATADEIKQAYHNFVRLLHPDAVRDPALQVLAEAQLKRINAVFDVLNDAKRRTEYDAHNDQGQATELVVAQYARTRPPTMAGSSVWGAAVVVALLVLIWIAAGPPESAGRAHAAEAPIADPIKRSVELASIVDNTAAPMPVEVAQQLRQLRRELRAAQNEQRTARVELAAEADSANAEVNAPSEDDDDPTPAPPLVSSLGSKMTQTRAPTPAGLPPQSSLIGTWLYAQRAGEAPKKDWYPPDYIELKIQPLADGVAGRYQGRYRVGDRPISPEVRFHFESKAASGKGEALSWTGANGAKGEIRLRQTSALTLQVDWTTTEPGRVPSLTAGSSLLVRSPQ